MISENLVLGALTADDFYFAFEEKGIEALTKLNSLKGQFVCSDNKTNNKLLLMKLIVNVFEPNKNCLSSYINIAFDNKIVHFNIVKGDFINWFIEVDEFTVENGPNYRDGSSNVYITRGNSRKYLGCRNEILHIMQQAKTD